MEQQQEQGPSKNQLKKLEKEKKKAEQKAARQAKKEETTTTTETADVSVGKYGNLPVIKSETRPGRVFTDVGDLTAEKNGQTVLIRGRLHASRGKGNLVFIVVRQRLHSVQAVLSKGAEISKQMLHFVSGISKESIVDVEGVAVKTNEPIDATTQKNIEIQIKTIFVVSSSTPLLPFQLEDASRPSSVYKAQQAEVTKIEEEITKVQQQLAGKEETEEGKKLAAQLEELAKKKSEAQKYVKVKRDTRLNNRILDLRTQANQGIFKLQSAVCELFRECLLKDKFTEIHTPKLIGCASEGGANVFKVTYFDKFAFLAQSPQLYKQMCICADMERVFEVAPVFRAELSFTHRHLTEFVGLDLEMAFNEHYHEVLETLENLFIYIFKGLETRFAKELEIIGSQYPFEPFKCKIPVVRLKYSEGIAMLKEAGVQIGDYEDMSTPVEKLLGKLVKQKYDTDFFVLDKFPTEVRPFYTMPDPENPKYANAYDFFIRGEEILSGAQRVHVPELLEQRAKECGVALDGIKDYVDSFRYGAPPHAGGGIGLERVVMLYLGLKNIRHTSMYPRDPRRLNP